MAEKPTTAAGYAIESIELVRGTCLYVATKLGDLLDDVVVVGGLVPSLLVNQKDLGDDSEGHAGTMDLDLGLSLAILEDERYQGLAQRLRDAGFTPDVNDKGNQANQRWKIEEPRRVTVDFLIPTTQPEQAGGGLLNLEADLAAVVTPGLHLAHADRRAVEVSGRTLAGEQATRSIWVCGPGAFLVLKALAFLNRGANKDAYDLYYVLSNMGIDEVMKSLTAIREDPKTQEALQIIRDDFSGHDGVGPRRVAEFVASRPDDDIQADVVGFVSELLAGCEEWPSI